MFFFFLFLFLFFFCSFFVLFLFFFCLFFFTVDLQTRSCATDGEAAMIGQHSGAYHYFTTEDGLNEPDFPWQHDLCHDLELKLDKWRIQINDEHDGIFQTCHTWLRWVYSRYSRSPNKTRNLAELAKERGTSMLKLVNIFEIRFLISEMKSARAFLHDLPCIAEDIARTITLIGNSNGNTAAAIAKQAEKKQLNSFKKQVLQRKMVMFLLILVDIHTVNIEFSANAQSQSLLVCDLVAMKKLYETKLLKMKSTLLEDGCCATSLPCLLKGVFENKAGMQVKLSGMSMMPVDSDDDSNDERAVDPAKTKQQLMKLQKEIVTKLILTKKKSIGGAPAKEFCNLPKCSNHLDKVLNLDNMSFLSNSDVPIPDDFAGK
jgi:hypothetical protein